MDKLVDDVSNAKLGSPLRVSYNASPVLMYAQMRPSRDMDINDVLERADDGSAEKEQVRITQ